MFINQIYSLVYVFFTIYLITWEFTKTLSFEWIIAIWIVLCFVNLTNFLNAFGFKLRVQFGIRAALGILIGIGYSFYLLIYIMFEHLMFNTVNGGLIALTILLFALPSYYNLYHAAIKVKRQKPVTRASDHNSVLDDDI